MAKVKIEYDRPLKDGIPLIFKAPCDCTAVDGIRVYYSHEDGEESQEFTFRDTHGNDLEGLDNLFKAGALVVVHVDIVNGHAYIQNADTNSYLEGRFDGKENRLTRLTEADLDAMWDGTYEGVEDDDAVYSVKGVQF